MHRMKIRKGGTKVMSVGGEKIYRESLKGKGRGKASV